MIGWWALCAFVVANLLGWGAMMLRTQDEEDNEFWFWYVVMTSVSTVGVLVVGIMSLASAIRGWEWLVAR